MAYQRHILFSLPADSNDARIWRYQDLPRLLHLIQSNALHFARADTLGDLFEGSISVATIKLATEPVPRISKTFQLKSAISCWHMNEVESAAMWSLYGLADKAVAICATIARLIEAIQSAPQEVYIGTVSYIDYDATPMDLSNALTPLLHKRRSYAHECELRALTLFPAPAGTWDNANNPRGLLVPIDVSKLVEAIYVAPAAPAWYVDTVRKAIPAGIEVRQSKLGESPIF